MPFDEYSSTIFLSLKKFVDKLKKKKKKKRTSLKSWTHLKLANPLKTNVSNLDKCVLVVLAYSIYILYIHIYIYIWWVKILIIEWNGGMLSNDAIVVLWFSRNEDIHNKERFFFLTMHPILQVESELGLSLVSWYIPYDCTKKEAV